MWKLIWKYVQPHRGTLLAISAIIAVMAGLNQVEPFITRRITDSVIEKQSSDVFGLIGILLATLLCVKMIQATHSIPIIDKCTS